MDRKTERELIQDLKVEEGFRSKPYRDTMNNLTIGYGHNLGGRLLSRSEHKLIFGKDYAYPLSIGDMAKILHDNPMPEDVALVLLKSDISICYEDALTVFGERWLSFPRDIKVSILDMLFNLGLKKYLKFKKHIKALEVGDYEEAAKQVLKSLAYTQAPHRYKAIHDRILNAQPDPSPPVEVCYGKSYSKSKVRFSKVPSKREYIFGGRIGEFAEDAHFWSQNDNKV